MKILVVDDEPKIRELIGQYITVAGYETEFAKDGIEALNIISKGDVDMVILDVMMPFMDGITCLKEMRSRGFKTPVIILSAKGEEYDKITGFEAGTDDYIVKPFSPKELMARINAVLTRVNAQTSTPQGNLQFDGLEINIPARTVTVDGEKIDLTPKEYELLFYLVENKNIALSRDKLLSDIWGYDFFGDDRTIDTHIKNLRNNLGPYRDFIVTLRGVGYKFEYES